MQHDSIATSPWYGKLQEGILPTLRLPHYSMPRPLWIRHTVSHSFKGSLIIFQNISRKKSETKNSTEILFNNKNEVKNWRDKVVSNAPASSYEKNLPEIINQPFENCKIQLAQIHTNSTIYSICGAKCTQLQMKSARWCVQYAYMQHSENSHRSICTRARSLYN